MKIQYQASALHSPSDFYESEWFESLGPECDTFEEALEHAKQYVRQKFPKYFRQWSNEGGWSEDDEETAVSVVVRVVGDYRAWL